ncbi:MAG: hypothetical protein ACRDNK_00625 [Solirubrobacteraceae bacterium]
MRGSNPPCLSAPSRSHTAAGAAFPVQVTIDRREVAAAQQSGEHGDRAGEHGRGDEEGDVVSPLSFALVLFAFGGGLFIPLSQYSQALRQIATFTPLYGLNQLVHAPLTGSTPSVGVVVNVLVWLVIFTIGATWRFRRDTARA